MVFCLVLVALYGAFLQFEGFCKSFNCALREKNKEGKLHFKLAQKFPLLSFETTKASSVVKDFSRTIQL